ncbi:alpha/beta hydrolase [Jidongwangia harbinensis]|uniref:alpha/beta hydrolase n=1 Tax=Jidongwangia harbinensis TaxID=2878561 RepID=UPI001CD987C5|nr:alpha/beta hydrolase [Jidongwangia harbinensis]MCA2214822.1 alpha/beta hydrolase [Jidongwangia harbinensis]
MPATTRPILAVFLTLVAVVAAAPPAAADRGTGLRWRPCAEDDTARCAKLRVPIDRADPYSGRVDIAVARRPATDPARRIGVLVVNPGGPGGSGVDMALGAAEFFSPEVRARFDIVGFDPRGVGRSRPVVCTRALVDATPSPLPTTPQEYLAVIAHNRRLAADCRRQTGPVFDHVDTLSVVHDLEALRAALGERRLTFYGASYGTLLGAQYAQEYPDRVRAVALDSVVDHSVGTAAFLSVETDSVQAAFEQFVAWCARDPLCALRGRNVPALWASLRARAAAGTLWDPYRPAYRLTVFDLIGVAFSSFYDPQWYSLAYYLKDAEAGARRTAARRVDLVEHTFPAVFCADWRLPVDGWPTLARVLRNLRNRAPQMWVSPLAASAVVGCLGWPTPAANPQRALRPASTPTLLINARYDPATALAWARNVAAQLGPAATLVTYRGWGHVVYGRSPCVTSVVDRYLIDLRRPPAGAACPGVAPDPFGVGVRAPARRGYR